MVYLFDGIEKIQLVLFCFFCLKFLIKQKGNKIGSLCVSVLGGGGGRDHCNYLECVRRGELHTSEGMIRWSKSSRHSH